MKKIVKYSLILSLLAGASWFAFNLIDKPADKQLSQSNPKNQVIKNVQEISNTPAGSQSKQGIIQKNIDLDAQLLIAYNLINQQKITEALAQVDNILALYPKFKLAQTLKEILQQSIDKQDSSNISSTIASSAVLSSSVQLPPDLLEEANLRLQAAQYLPKTGFLPKSLIYLSEQQKTALIVDEKTARLFVYENVKNRPRYLFDYYITLGEKGAIKTKEGDYKTPIGVYRLEKQLPKKGLADLYGHGAMPITFPNHLDKLANITGHGIWLHGVPSNTYARLPKASRGCVVLSNDNLQRVFKFTQADNTPIIIDTDHEWIDLNTWKQQQTWFLGLFQAWKDALTTYDEALLKAYNFSSDNEYEWANINQFKTYQNLDKIYQTFLLDKKQKLLNTDNLSMYYYPSKKNNLILIEFDAIYETLESPIKRKTMRVQQFWQLQGINQNAMINVKQTDAEHWFKQAIIIYEIQKLL